MSETIIKETQQERLWWLNEESQQILNRGYLLKGETAKSAIERVANAAAKGSTSQNWLKHLLK